MTNQNNKGVWEKSDALDFALSRNLNFKLHFLEPFLSTMKAPEIVEMRFEFTGTVNSSAGNDALGLDAHKLCNRLRVADKFGAWIDCSGEGLRIHSIIEMAARHVDMTTLAAGAADASRTWFVNIPLDLIKAERGRDSCIQAWQLQDGGSVVMTTPTALPTGWDGFTGTVTLWCKVRDGRRRESKSRISIRDYVINSQQDNYSVDGSLRSMVVFTELATTSMTSLAAFTTIDSTALGYPPGMKTSVLRADYIRQLDGAAHANDPIISELAIPLVFPDRRQKIGQQPILGTVRIDLKAAPAASSRMLVVAFVDRDPRLGAQQLGYPDVTTAMAAAGTLGEVVSAKGKNIPLAAMSTRLQRLLPQRIAGTPTES